MQTRSRSSQETPTNKQVNRLNTQTSTEHNGIPANVLTQMEGIRTRAQLRAAVQSSNMNGFRQSPRLNGNLPDYSSFF